MRGLLAITRRAGRVLDFLLATALGILGLGAVVLAASLAARLPGTPLEPGARFWLGAIPVLILAAGLVMLLAAGLLARLALAERRIRRCVEQADYRGAARCARWALGPLPVPWLRRRYAARASQLDRMADLYARAVAASRRASRRDA